MFNKANLELITNLPIEIVRSRDGEYFRGYAVTFYDGTEKSEYKMGTNTVERVAPDAFDDILRSGKRVELQYNHDDSFVLGSTEDDLEIFADNIGLGFKMPIDPVDIDHQRAKQKIDKRIVRGMSFRGNGTTNIQRNGAGYIRTIRQIDELVEISLVHRPAYKGTSVFVRSEIENFEAIQARIEKAKKLS